MSSRRKKWKGKIFILLIGAMLYSFLPLVFFWLSKDAAPPEKNETVVEKLKDNKGSYFSFIVFGDNHSGLAFNDAATLKEIWHINREDRFRKVPIDFVLNVGDVALDQKRAHFRAYNKILDLIKFPVVFLGSCTL